MALTLDESAQLINNTQFRGRVKVAALKYASYLALQPNPNLSRSRWIQQTIQQPDQTAQTITPAVVMNVNVQNLGANIDDDNLMAAVQVVSDQQM